MVSSNDLKKSYRLLLYIQNNINLEILERIFHKNMASHLWNKFVYYDRNLLLFINYLDEENFELFFQKGIDDNLLI